MPFVIWSHARHTFTLKVETAETEEETKRYKAQLREFVSKLNKLHPNDLYWLEFHLSEDYRVMFTVDAKYVAEVSTLIEQMNFPRESA